MQQRGLTPVLGLVLLVGITAIASMAILFVGMSLADTTQSSAEYEQAEQSMAQLAESGDQIAMGDAQRARFSIRGSSSAQVQAVSDAGTINVTVRDRENDTQLMAVERSLGAIVYETDDGSEVAYQGGGVWRHDPSGHSSLVRAPEFHYRANPDPTITFPVMLVRDDYTSSGQTSGDLVAQTSERHYPDRPSHYNPLQHGSVRIAIDSEYCEGWEEYFEQRTDGSPAEDCDAGTEGELVIQFSVPFNVEGFEGGVMVGGGASNFDHEDVNDSNISDSSGLQSVTPLVEDRIETAQDEGQALPDPGTQNITADPTDDGPTIYYDDGNLEGNHDIHFDTSEGDIEVASDQSTVLSGHENITISGGGNVTIYAYGELLQEGGGDGRLGEPGKESQFRLFVHSDVDQVGKNGQNTDFYGLVYAPNSEVYLGRCGDCTVSGAVVAEELDVGNADFNIDPDVRDLSIYHDLGDAPFYYLHISETVVEVED